MSNNHLRVGLDVRATEPGFKAHYGRGTGRYASELTRTLMTLVASQKTDVDIAPASSTLLGASELEKAVYNNIPYGRHTLEQQILLPKRIQKIGFDLFHFFAHVDAPANLKTPYVVSVLDLIPLKFEEMYKAGKPNWRFKFARWLEKKAIQNATGIIAISEATKRDVVELLGIEADKIVVTPLAVGPDFYPRATEIESMIAQRSSAKLQFGLPNDRPVVLYVGGIDARKNVPFLLDVFAEVHRKAGENKKPVLAIVGRLEKDDKYPALLEQISNLGLKSDVQLLGYIDDQDLPQVYHAADVLAFSSLYEGFGFPVLEAMSCAIPVVAANNSSIPEVVGDSSSLLADNDKDAWVEEISQVLASPQRQAEMANAGLKRSKMFSWESTASLTIEAYEKFSGFSLSNSSLASQDRGESRAALG